MPNVTFTFGAATKTYTITAANAARFLAWATAAYPTIPNPAYDAVTNPGVPQTIPNPNPVASAIDGLWAGIRNNVISHEKSLGAAAVAQPVDLT